MLAISIGLGLSYSHAQTVQNDIKVYHDTFLENGSVVIKERVENVLKKFPIPYKSGNINASKVALAINEHKDFVAFKGEANPPFLIYTESHYSFSYDYVKNIWKEPSLIDTKNHYVMLILTPLFMLIIFLMAKYTDIGFWGCLIVCIISLIVFALIMSFVSAVFFEQSVSRMPSQMGWSIIIEVFCLFVFSAAFGFLFQSEKEPEPEIEL